MSDVDVRRAEAREYSKDYWDFVFDEALPSIEGRSIDEGLMTRHGSTFLNVAETPPPPTDLLGEPHYSDGDVLVWRLRRGGV